MEVLETLAISGNASLQKMYEFLQDPSLQQVVGRGGFPVKIQIPIGMIIKADATFNKFRFLPQDDSLAELFLLPPECKLVPRSVGMKTMQNKKKRLAVANLAT